MNSYTIYEWGYIRLDEVNGPSRAIANQWLASAATHQIGGEDGIHILSDHHSKLRAGQVVGVIAGESGCLEILPKIDDANVSDCSAVRRRLMHMLSVALDLEIETGALVALGQQNETLLDIIIRRFVDLLLAQVHRGLPRHYVHEEGDLLSLRGSLNIVRQFSTLAVSPQRLACRFDELSADTPLLQVCKATLLFVRPLARSTETLRRIDEVRVRLADVADLSRAALPWDRVAIDRTNRNWRTLFGLARMFLHREWQTSALGSAPGFSLLFKMNDLFEVYVEKMLARSLGPLGYRVRAQGGRLYCLNEIRDDGKVERGVFQTRPDIIVEKFNQLHMIIDTKWKRLSANVEDRKRGISQSDVYQMMAYGQVYGCEDLVLLYPHHAELGGEARRIARLRISGSNKRLRIETLGLESAGDVIGRLVSMVTELEPEPQPQTV